MTHNAKKCSGLKCVDGQDTVEGRAIMSPAASCSLNRYEPRHADR
jgi:hypothetical protein